MVLPFLYCFNLSISYSPCPLLNVDFCQPYNIQSLFLIFLSAHFPVPLFLSFYPPPPNFFTFLSAPTLYFSYHYVSPTLHCFFLSIRPSFITLLFLLIISPPPHHLSSLFYKEGSSCNSMKTSRHIE